MGAASAHRIDYTLMARHLGTGIILPLTFKLEVQQRNIDYRHDIRMYIPEVISLLIVM
jgi:hypothetical protein